MRFFHFVKTLLCFAIAATMFIACEKEEPIKSAISFKDETKIVESAGGEVFVAYTTTGTIENLNVSVDNDWVHDLDLSNEGYVGLIVDKNNTEMGRTAILRLTADGCEDATMKIVQIKGDAPAFTITVEEVGADTATYSVVPYDDQKPYISMVVPRANIDIYGDDDDSFFLADLMYFQELATAYEVTLEDVIRSTMLNGPQQMKWTGLSQATEYCAYAYGITVLGQRTTPITRQYFTTEPIVSTNQLSLDIANISTVEFDLIIGATNEEDGYIWEVMESSWFDGLSDEEVLQFIKDAYGEYVDMIVEYGAKTIHLGPEMIEPDTEYTAVLFGYEAGGMTTPMIRKTFRTEKGVAPADLTFTFDVSNVGMYSADITVMPSGNSVYYYWDVVNADYTAEQFKALMDQYVNDFIAEGIVESAQEFWTDMVSRGNDGDTVGQLNSNTEYKPVAVAIDLATATFAGEVHFGTPFRTQEAVLSDAKVTIYHNEYFDGDALVERYASQGLYTSYLGLAYVPFYPVLENNPAHYHYAIFYNDDNYYNEEWSDESLMHLLLQDCLTDIDRWYPGLDYDTDFLLLAIAEDANGHFGPLYREKLRFSRDGVTDINLFEEVVKSPKSVTFSVERPALKLTTARMEQYQPQSPKAATEWQSRLELR